MAFSEISLQWNEYKTNMITNLQSLFLDESYTDVTLVSDGGSLKAHKVVLSACSPLFKNIFEQNPCQHPVIVLHEIAFLSLRTLLAFIYKGEVNVTEDYLPQLLKAAESLKIKGLSIAGEVASDESTVQSNLTQSKDDWKKLCSAPGSPMRFSQEIVTLNKCKDEIESDESQEYSHPDSDVLPSEIKVEAIISESEDSIIGIDNEFFSPIESDYTKKYSEFCLNKDLSKLENQCIKIPPKLKRNGGKLPEEPPPSKQRSVACTKQMEDHDEVKTGIPDEIPHNENAADSLVEDVILGVAIEKEIESVLHSGANVETLNSGICDMAGDNALHGSSNSFYANPTFPCPFCDRVYHSWGYRRRHVKTRHGTNNLACKWCAIMLNSQAAWFKHAVLQHGVSRSEARDSLVVMVEAHAVLASLPSSPEALLNHLQLTTHADTHSKQN